MKILFLTFFVANFATNFVMSQFLCPVQLIVNPASGLVLDGSNNVVTVEKPNGSTAQLWLIEPSTDGSVTIINKKTE